MAMSPPQQFCLRWNNHQSNIITVFEQLLQTEAFVDVTLAVEGMSLKAHKVVLSACSPYFQAILAAHQDKHPIVILKDVRYSDMRDLLDFMYRGEVSVDQDNLPGFLRVAKSLRIKGLTEVNDRERLDSSSSPFLLQHSAAVIGGGANGIPSSSSTTITDTSNLKRLSRSPPPLDVGPKRRRGRPPKISGEDESESENGPSTDKEDVAPVKLEVKEEPVDYRESHECGDPVKESEGKNGESPTLNEGKTQTKDLAKAPPSEDGDVRRSPRSGTPAEWISSEYETDDTNHSGPLHHNSSFPVHSKPSPVTDIDQLYYTKNLLEAAILKNPYDALKNDKHLHGSILLASLRAPLKFGFHGFNDRDVMDRELIDSSPHTSHNSSPPKPSQSSPTPNNTSSSGSSNSSSNTKVSVPIMSYCIQDNGFKCSKCFQTFTHPSNFHRHYITVHTDRRAHKCHVCGKEFKRKDNMMSHIRSVHRPGKEGHSIFRDVSPRDVVPPLQEALFQPVDKV